MRASVSIPGVFSPTQIDGRWLIDGGAINPVPVSALRALGAHRSIAVNPNAKHDRKLWSPEPETGFWEKIGLDDLRRSLPHHIAGLLPETTRDPAPAYMDVVSATIDIMTEYLRKTREASDPPDVSLEADLLDVSVLELYRAAKCIDEGHRIARDAADRIAAMLRH